MDYVIERAKPEDAEQFLAYLKQIGGESDNLSFGPEGLPFTVEQEEAFLKSMLTDKNAIFVAKKDGRIIGDCSFTSLSRRFSHRGELGLTVLKEYWHCGIGTALMQKIITFAKESAGAEVISLEVKSDNMRAIALYERFGFERLGTYKKFFKVGDRYFDAELMNLYL
ncbi:MAG TPA: GNAT family N-acetyltransferase [Candidatus Pelethocola excrementipullorum]|nr:GNAT family N-acetyltransferase [Candidatus Pelethocola excrementipullorum]